VVKKSAKDSVLLIGAGVTLHEALKAAATLEKSGVNARVLDPFTIKPLDVASIVSNALECGGRVVTVEDHYPEGGLGEAVLTALADQAAKVKVLAVREVPRSGPPTDLINKYGIGADSIVEAVKSFA
jgi:transketolase